MKSKNVITQKNNALFYLPCPVCGSQKYNVLYNDNLTPKKPLVGYNFTPEAKKTFRIIQCIECSHTYCSPIQNNIYENYIEVVDKVYLKDSTSRIISANNVVKILLRYKKHGKLLDIGCSTGDFLKVASKFYESEGLEISKWAVKIASKKRIIINEQLLSDLNVKKTYDIITLWGVIEHFEDIQHEIELLKKHLNKKGIVALWTGDVGSYVVGLLGRKWWHFIGQHLHFFTQKSIDRLFLNNGFTKIYSGKYPYVKSLQSISYSLNVYPIVGKLFNLLFNNRFGAKIHIKLSLPSEMFIIYQLKH